MNLPQHLTNTTDRLAFYRDFFARMEALPGVVSVGGTTRVPLGSTSVSTTVQIEGRPVPAAELPEVQFRRAMHNYFEAMGIPIRRGRDFDPNDGADGAAGRRHQRDDGAQAVPEPGSDRPARAHRPERRPARGRRSSA